MWGGPWSHPFELFRWAVLGRLASATPCVVSVGAGPLDAWLSRVFIRRCLALSRYRSLRDTYSREFIRKTGFRGECQVYPDLAQSLPALQTRAARPRAAHDKLSVGINPMPVFDGHIWPSGSGDIAAAYRRSLADFAYELIQEQHDVFFFGMHPKDEHVMREVIELIETRGPIHADSSRLAIANHTVAELVETINRADAVVATRFHAAVLPLAMGIPTIGIAYDPKTPALLTQMGQADCNIEFDELDRVVLLDRFRTLSADLGDRREKLRLRAAMQKRASDEQYELLARFVAGADVAASARDPGIDADRR